MPSDLNPTNEERIVRVEKLIMQVTEQLDNPDFARVKGLLDLIKFDADNQHQLNVNMANSHLRQAEEVVTSLAAIKTLQVNEAALVEAALGNPL